MNWGNKLLLTFIVFGIGMFYLVYRSMRTNYDLVEKDYYNQELRYQQKIDAANRTNALQSAVVLEQTEQGVHVQLPLEMKNKTLNGDIWFYCAYDAGKDKKISLRTDSNARQLIPLQQLEPGNYTVKLNWTESGQTYYAEKTFTIL